MQRIQEYKSTTRLAPFWLLTLDNIIRLDESFIVKTFCKWNADRIVYLLNRTVPRGWIKDLAPEKWIDCDEVKSTSPTHPELVDFFSDHCPEAPIANIYRFKVPGHYFAIVKYANAEGPFWRVYEGWAKTLSIPKWLSSERLHTYGYCNEKTNPIAAAEINRHRDEFGQGKLLNAVQVRKFLQTKVDFCCSELKNGLSDKFQFEIQRFAIDLERVPALLTKELERVEHEMKEKEALYDKEEAHYIYFFAPTWVPSFPVLPMRATKLYVRATAVRDSFFRLSTPPSLYLSPEENTNMRFKTYSGTVPMRSLEEDASMEKNAMRPNQIPYR